MPGEHIDKIVNEAVAKLNYVPLTTEQLRTATQQEKDLDSAKRDKEVGSDIFKEIENSGLTPTEKQEAYQRIVKAGVQHQVDRATDPTTLLRENNATARFMTDYMNTYAKGYMEAVYEDSLKAAIQAKSQLPESLVGKKIDSPFAPLDDVSPEDKAKLYEGYRDVAKTAIQSTEQNLSKLSPDARAFMQAALEPAGNNKQAMNMATASTLLLRGASPMMSSSGALLRDNPETQDVGNLLLGANIAMQTYANSMNRSVDNPLPSVGKPQNVVCNELRSPEAMDQTKLAYKAISEGSDKIDEFVDGLEVEDEVVDVDLAQDVEKLKATAGRLELERQAKAKEVEMKAMLKPFNNRLKELGDRKAQLETNPSIGDRIKCFFKHGLKGVDGEIEKINGKMAIVEKARESVEKERPIGELRKELDNMKVDRAEFALAMEMAKSAVTLDNAAASVNMPRSMTKEQTDNVINTHERAKVEKEQLGASIKEKEKVLSVREQLGPKETAKHTEGPKKGVHVG